MKLPFIVLSAAVVALLCATSAICHHSNSAYEVDRVVTVAGVVKEWKWSNPHTWLHLMVDDGKGGKVEWELEGRAPGVLGRIGWDKLSLKAGEKVTVHMSPAKNGSKIGIIARVTKEDGTILGNSAPTQ